MPEQCVDLTFNLGPPNAASPDVAPLGVQTSIQVVPAFKYGNNPAGGAPIVSSTPTVLSLTPTVLKLEKKMDPPEAERATGPNYPFNVTLTANIADGQTITNLVLKDVLPPEFQLFDGTVTVTGCGGAVTIDASNTATTSNPGGTVARQCATKTGSTASNDVVMTFKVFIPEKRADNTPVLTATSPSKLIVNDEATADAKYNNVSLPQASASDQVTAKVFAVRKTANKTSIVPGDTVTYTITLDMSDYFAIDQLEVTDILGDGQTYGSATYSVIENGSTLVPSTVITPTVDATQKTGSTLPRDGTTKLIFDVGAALGANHQLDGDHLLGNPTNGNQPGDGKTQVIITFTATVDNDFSALNSSGVFPGPGTAPLSQKDVVNNTVSATAPIVAPQAGTYTDGSGTTLPIDGSALEKAIYGYCPNGVDCTTTLPSPFYVKPGDWVTYRLTINTFFASYENLKIEDFLPIPFFSASGFNTAEQTGFTTVPDAGHWGILGTDTFTNTKKPPLVTIGTSNNIIWDYGSYQGQDSNQTIDIIFTVKAQNNPMASDLNLANLAVLTFNNSVTTATNPSVVNGVVRNIITGEPKITAQKTIISATNPACVTGTAPTGYDALYQNCDAGDKVTFQFELKNTGRFDAYNVLVNDNKGLPTGALSCAAPTVKDGAGTTLSQGTDWSGDLYDASMAMRLLIIMKLSVLPMFAPFSRLHYRCWMALTHLPALLIILHKLNTTLTVIQPILPITLYHYHPLIMCAKHVLFTAIFKASPKPLSGLL
jgi:uncharacterized repeat protein (TIGR01451 family)